MQSSEFQTYFKNVPSLSRHYVGTFPIDLLPTKIDLKTFFIANLDPSTKNGSHWIAFVKVNPEICEIFDSLGFCNKLEIVKPYLNFKEKIEFIFNETPVQSKESILCGKFCIMFIIERMLNQTMDFSDLLSEIFSNDLIKNDEIVSNFCENVLKNNFFI